MPEGTVAPPPAAVSAPAAPAPVSAPAAPPVAAPAAPASIAAPVSAPAGPAKPDYAKISDPSERIQADLKYTRDLAAFNAENPTVEVPEEKPVEAPNAVEPTAEAPAEIAPEKVEEAQPEVAEETFTLDEEPAITPQALNELIKAKPERAEYLSKDPEFKNALMKMSREHSELVQFKGIFATAESANFSKKTADRTVNLRTKFQMAETPENMAAAFDDFMQEFAVTGPDGKQLVENGQPVYSDDLALMTEHIVHDRYIKAELTDVEARIAADKYSSVQAKQDDLDRKIALQILQGDFVPQERKDPDLSAIPEELRADIQKRLDEAKAIEAKNAEIAGNRKKISRDEQRKQSNAAFWGEYSSRVSNQVNDTLGKLRKAGVRIPDWELQVTYPNTNTPIFYDKIGKAVDALINADPYTRKMALDLELLPPTPENIKTRMQWSDGLLNQHNKHGISNLRQIIVDTVRAFGKNLDEQAAAVPAPTTTASPEPKGGGATAPKFLSPDEAFAQAEKDLSKTERGWANMDMSERLAKTFAKRKEILGY